MSWQEYVDHNLVGTGSVTSAAIIGLDGNTWAHSANFQIDSAEGGTLVSHFKDDAAKAKASGILVNKTKYMFIKQGEYEGDSYRLLIGKKAATGVSVYKTEKALVIGVYGEGIMPGQCNKIVTNLGVYLVSVGF